VTGFTARAPGRVNLIGDHTDHTGGFCFPIAIAQGVQISGTRQGDRVRIRSDTEPTVADVPLDVGRPADVEPPWARYVAAVVAELRPTVGLEAVVTSDLPQGVGLSSSAALEVALALVLGADATDPVALAQLCRAAEHAARQVPTGILDQLASICGRAGHGLLIDCGSLDVTTVPLPPPDEIEWRVITPTRGRDLAASHYATRVAELARVERAIGPLRDARMSDVDTLDDTTLRARARHVVGENQRVHEFAAAVELDDVKAAGALMTESHRSLSVDFESSTPAIDDLCRQLDGRKDVLGARITGGGWGGAVVALTRPGALADLSSAVVVTPADGARCMCPGDQP
jgi:galactokinase